MEGIDVPLELVQERPGEEIQTMDQVPVKNGMCLCTTYIVMNAFLSNTELIPFFQSTGTLVPLGIPAESGQNVPPSSAHRSNKLRSKIECHD